jgi:hypothetical protein
MEHSKLAVSCEVAESENPEGCSDDQELQLRCRKRTPGQQRTEADRWRDMYRILFPSVEESAIPSPCGSENTKLFEKVLITNSL